MITYGFLILIVIFFAMNMGASGIAPSFAAVFGGKIIKRENAMFLFAMFVIVGAIILGRNVSLTLGRTLLPSEVLNPDTALIIIASASLSLFLANVLKIPQSTSQVTVGAITGTGIYFGGLNLKMLLIKIIPMWVILPFLSYLITLLVYRKIYPPQNDKMGIYERISCHEKKLKITAILVSCYVAFAIGSNNVANAVGPLFGAGLVGILPGLIAISPIFGLGAYFLGKGPLDTAGKEIVPLGIFSSALVSFVTATLLLFASLLGVPQSLVQLNICSIFAISSLKNGHRETMDLYIARRTFIIWAVTPMLSVFTSYLILFMKNRLL